MKLIGWKPKSQDQNIASVRFRCLSPLGELRRIGVEVELYSSEQDAADAYHTVIFSKLYGAEDQRVATSLIARGVRTILDISDNHFYNPRELPAYVQAGRDLKRMCEIVDRVVCCSPHLAEVVSQHAALKSPPLVVGDAVEDMSTPHGARDPFQPQPGHPFRIVWFGSHGSPNAPSGMEDILRIADHLAQAHSTRPCELVIVSNDHAKFLALAARLALPCRYVEWADGALMSEFARANLVVVPVARNPFTWCKSNNRVATALWYGLPVLADWIPAYGELADFALLDDWDRGFSLGLSGSPDLRVRTMAGQAYVQANFDLESIGRAWVEAIEAVAEKSLRPGAVCPSAL